MAISRKAPLWRAPHPPVAKKPDCAITFRLNFINGYRGFLMSMILTAIRSYAANWVFVLRALLPLPLRGGRCMTARGRSFWRC